MSTDDRRRIVFPPLMHEQQKQIRAAIEAAYREQAGMLAQGGGAPFPSSTELIRQAREERTRRLMGDPPARDGSQTDT